MDQWIDGCTVMKMPAVILVKLHSEGDTDSEEGRRRDLDGADLIPREGWHPWRGMNRLAVSWSARAQEAHKVNNRTNGFA